MWCARRDSNQQPPASRAGASTAWATRAIVPYFLALVVPAGLEPATSPFVAGRSDPLSYGTGRHTCYRVVSASGFEPETTRF